MTELAKCQDYATDRNDQARRTECHPLSPDILQGFRRRTDGQRYHSDIGTRSLVAVQGADHERGQRLPMVGGDLPSMMSSITITRRKITTAKADASMHSKELLNRP